MTARSARRSGRSTLLPRALALTRLATLISRLVNTFSPRKYGCNVAVVKQATVKLFGVPFKKVYNFDAKSGSFSMKLPDIVRRELNLDCTTIIGSSVEDLDRQLDSLVQQVKDKQTVVTKVLAFSAKLTATIWEDVADEDGDRRILSKSEEVSFADGLAVSLTAGVYVETKISLDNGFTVKYVYQDSTIPRAFRKVYDRDVRGVVPWTQELEDTIAAYCVKLQAVALEAKELEDMVASYG